MSDSSSPSDSAGSGAESPVVPDDHEALAAAVDRYHRVELAVSWALALLVAGAFLAVVAAVSFWPGVAVAAVLAIALRVPIYRRRGSVRLRTEVSPGAVVREFASSRPPILAFQWGVADEVRDTGGEDGTATDRPTGTRAIYEFSYLLGLRSAAIDLETDVRADATPTGDERGGSEGDTVATLSIDAAIGDSLWGSYTVTVQETDDGDGTIVDVELLPTRRFDLRRLSQGRVAERYYAETLAAQGYEVFDRTVSLTR
ncbi:hypothetical protein FK85_10015 [Halorubrum saccharovorum]|uniref:Uncharacterized protein n=1 Tax=Halorubrum saccharovorum TaxID=2248 RepID=A0A081ETQ6_9EURY|nr:hypothetical protein [Halorubrum saccharovorum]KDS90794.1 hypothetical protein FK85_10015 [Halorubrum saccharovorum]